MWIFIHDSTLVIVCVYKKAKWWSKIDTTGKYNLNTTFSFLHYGPFKTNFTKYILLSLPSFNQWHKFSNSILIIVVL